MSEVARLCLGSSAAGWCGSGTVSRASARIASTGAVSLAPSWRIFCSSFLKRSFRFLVRSAITSSAPGWRTSSSKPRCPGEQGLSVLAFI